MGVLRSKTGVVTTKQDLHTERKYDNGRGFYRNEGKDSRNQNVGVVLDEFSVKNGFQGVEVGNRI